MYALSSGHGRTIRLRGFFVLFVFLWCFSRPGENRYLRMRFTIRSTAATEARRVTKGAWLTVLQIAGPLQRLVAAGDQERVGGYQRPIGIRWN